MGDKNNFIKRMIYKENVGKFKYKYQHKSIKGATPRETNVTKTFN